MSRGGGDDAALCSQLRSELQMANGTIAKLQACFEGTRAINAQFQETIPALMRDRDDAQERIVELEEQIGSLKLDKARLQGSVGALTCELERAQRRTSELKSENERLRGREDENNKSLASRDDLDFDVDAEIESLKTSLTRLTQWRESLSSARKTLRGPRASPPSSRKCSEIDISRDSGDGADVTLEKASSPPRTRPARLSMLDESAEAFAFAAVNSKSKSAASPSSKSSVEGCMERLSSATRDLGQLLNVSGPNPAALIDNVEDASSVASSAYEPTLFDLPPAPPASGGGMRVRHHRSGSVDIHIPVPQSPPHRTPLATTPAAISDPRIKHALMILKGEVDKTREITRSFLDDFDDAAR